MALLDRSTLIPLALSAGIVAFVVSRRRSPVAAPPPTGTPPTGTPPTGTPPTGTPPTGTPPSAAETTALAQRFAAAWAELHNAPRTADLRAINDLRVELERAGMANEARMLAEAVARVARERLTDPVGPMPQPTDLTPEQRVLLERFDIAWTQTRNEPRKVQLFVLDQLRGELSRAGFHREARILEEAYETILAGRRQRAEEQNRLFATARTGQATPPKERAATCISHVKGSMGCGILPPYAINRTETTRWRRAMLETGSKIVPMGARVTAIGDPVVLDITPGNLGGTPVLHYIPRESGRRTFFFVRYQPGRLRPITGWMEAQNLAFTS